MNGNVWAFLAGQLVGGLLAVGAAFVAWLKVRTQMLEARDAAVGASQVGAANHVKLAEVKELVNGQHHALLEEVRALKAALAIEQAKPKS